ncbi:efflux transporter outer membrane subunit [Caulobacter sp. UNC279MFTsu5.1]|uniref:efflux transporter outer membrane subunit n=1 Tax=Caulobacter sp. UNC279MFTsu5.1 TaxID=1502775 RepID=UPI0008E8EDBC|nr:efflux transporter outer membrane subunit [Caulobacter sp. UNC279MFTsu5.1]SFJ35610.1 efflux transporter, outer membrane factor (OMF) lipoprotein, NodT family [Caulobacter sp. UNC279MFTsu5.1]
MLSLKPLALAGASLILLSACTVGPAYEKPNVTAAALPATYKALDGWKVATPGDLIDRGDWWTLLGDPQLDALIARVNVSNQTIAAAEAGYRQARALVREQRASLFPTIDLSGSATRSGGSGSTSGAGGSSSGQRYQAGIGASWEPDLWGRIRQGINGAKASEQASAADLAGARLSMQGELAVNYLGLRQADAEIALVTKTVEGYQRSLQITQNRYAAAIAPKSDVLQATTQLAGAQADLESLRQTRATYENAIATLVGQPASGFRLAADPAWSARVPEIPAGVPSTLLERRPDIAAAERRVAAANADIGVVRAAFFPTLGLSANGAASGSSLGELFKASANTWSLGLTAAQTLFDAGARKARVEQARASYDAAVADYRQTALAAFEDVENQLTAAQVLERRHALLKTSSDAADQTEQMMLNQYKAGQVAYTDVVTAQASALSARRALLTAAVARQTTAVALIQALGGGWKASA